MYPFTEQIDGQAKSKESSATMSCEDSPKPAGMIYRDSAFSNVHFNKQNLSVLNFVLISPFTYRGVCFVIYNIINRTEKDGTWYIYP